MTSIVKIENERINLYVAVYLLLIYELSDVVWKNEQLLMEINNLYVFFLINYLLIINYYYLNNEEINNNIPQNNK